MLGINAGQQTYLWRLSSLKRSANPSTTFDAGLAKSLTLLISSPCLLPLAPSFAFVDARTSILRIMASLSLAPSFFFVPFSFSLFFRSFRPSLPAPAARLGTSFNDHLSLSLSLSRARVLARGRFSLSLPHSPALSSLSLVKMKWRKCFGFRNFFSRILEETSNELIRLFETQSHYLVTVSNPSLPLDLREVKLLSLKTSFIKRSLWQLGK